MSEDPRARIRRAAARALVAGLSIAALTAVAALVGGDFDDTELRVILTSIGFAIASSTAAAGAAQRLRTAGWLRALGTATVALAALAFVLLAAGLWTGDWGSEGIWRAFGCTALLGIAGAHACVVLGARRRADGAFVDLLVVGSLVLAAIDTVGGLLPVSGLADNADEGLAKLLAATLVLLVLTSVLPPILRRLQRDAAPPPAHVAPPPTGPRRDALAFLAGEVETAANRIENLSRGPAIRTPEIRREAERLRDLARSFQT